jgi:alanine dehydrogenase
MFLLLSEAEVRAVLSMDDLIETMQHALADFSANRVKQPLRTVLDIGSPHSFFGVMPAFMPETGTLGTKLVTVFGGNAALGLPSHLATIVLLDPSTGSLRCIMDGRYITEARTAAVSAVSARLLARRNVTTLAIIGSGVQARSHLEAMLSVRQFRNIRVWSPTPEHRQAFVERVRQMVDATLVASDSAQAAVTDADVVVLATAAREPVVRSEWIADGAHICAVGACRPDQREMDTALVSRARVFVDSCTAALTEAGDIVIPMREGAFGAAHIAGELGQLAAAGVQGRQGDGQVTLFKSLGMAVEDVAAAHLAYRRAQERGLGREATL